MAGEMYDLLIFLVVIIIVVGLILWTVSWLVPAANQPARYIVGGFALIAILIKLKPFIATLFSWIAPVFIPLRL